MSHNTRTLLAAIVVLLMTGPSLSFSVATSLRQESLVAVLQAGTSVDMEEKGTSQHLPPEDVQVVSCMPEPLPNPLRHQYYLLRHGQSTANVAAVISSARSNAYSERHGLTALGYEQGAQAAEALVKALEASSNKNEIQAGDKLTFVASPFARAKQTAAACLGEILKNDALQGRIEALGVELATAKVDDILLKDKLMERYFGRLDNEAIYTYAYVWPLDKFNVTHTAFGVESVAAVCTRIRELIVDDLEEQLEGRHHVVLASHADVLQISQLYGCGAGNVGAFSSYRFGNGEVRAMARTPDSLPDPAPLEAPERGTQV